MPVKRKSRGRSKGRKGRSDYVQCSICGQLVPRDKAKKVTRRTWVVDPVIAKELRQKGAWISTGVETKYYCVSCAVHHRLVRVRAKEERKIVPKTRRSRISYVRRKRTAVSLLGV